MKLMRLIAKRDREDQRFQAAIHGREMADEDGRFHGIRAGHMQRMKARRRGHV